MNDWSTWRIVIAVVYVIGIGEIFKLKNYFFKVERIWCMFYWNLIFLWRKLFLLFTCGCGIMQWYGICNMFCKVKIFVVFKIQTGLVFLDKLDRTILTTIRLQKGHPWNPWMLHKFTQAYYMKWSQRYGTHRYRISVWF